MNHKSVSELTLSLAARAGQKPPITEAVISKWSLPNKFKKKICNPSLLSKNYFFKAISFKKCHHMYLFPL